MYFVAVERRAPVLQSPLDADVMKELCRAALGSSLQVARFELLGSGHFNTTYRVELEREAPVVFRLGPVVGAHLWRHERALLRRQCSVQPILEQLGEVVPRLLHRDFSHELVARDWAIFESREGAVWDAVARELPASDAESLWRQYGELVHELHALRGQRFGFPAPWAAHDSFGAWFTELVEGLAADLGEQGIHVAGLAHFRALLRREQHRLDAVREPRLVHGDLWLRNVLVAPGPRGWRITSLLDAERAFYGEAAAEWIFGFLELPRAFWEAYGSRLDDASLSGDGLWRRRAYQARGALQMMLEGRRFGFDAGFAHRQFAGFCSELDRGADSTARHELASTAGEPA